MEKAIEGDIRISNVVTPVVDDVVINEVPVAGVEVQVPEPVVVNGEVDPRVVVVNVEHVQGGI